MTLRPSADADRQRAARDVDEELAFHRQRTIDELRAAGLDEAAADAEARRRFGQAAAYRRTLIDLETHATFGSRARGWLALLGTSARAVWRDARRAPGFTAGVLGILTLGLGVNAITFGLVDRLLLRGPAGVHAPEELRRVVVHRQTAGGAAVATPTLAYVDYLDLRRAAGLAGVAAETSGPVLVGRGEDAERIEARFVTAGYFPLLGTGPALGRFFTDEESAREGARVVVLGHAFWQRRFGGAADAIGQVIAVDAHRYTIVGVAAEHFTGSSVARTEIFLPLEAAADELVSGDWRTNPNFGWIQAIVRLAPEVTAAAVTSELTTMRRRSRADVSGADPDARIALAPLSALRGATASGDAGVAALVGVVALLVLVIAVANTANLFLARALRRRDRVAVRLALGGSRARLIAEHALEGALLALAGAALAVVVAMLGAPLVQRLVFPEIAWGAGVIDTRLLLAIAGCAVLSGALAASLPMWHAGRTDVSAWLRLGSGRASQRRTRPQAAMIVVQAALSVILLVGAGIFGRSLARAEAVDLGLDTDRVLVVSTIAGDLPLDAGFRDELRARIERIPGVEGTTLVAGTLPFVSSWAVSLRVAGLPERPRVEDGGPYIHAVEPDYFRMVGTDIVQGRAFTAGDRAGAPLVTIVNETMARLFWPGESALGKCLHIGSDSPPCSIVIGVAENTRRQDFVEGDSLLYYIPIDQATGPLRAGGQLIVRTTDAGRETIARVGEAIRRQALMLAPGLRHVTARSIDSLVAPDLRAWRLGAGLLSVFGALALVISTVGIYSVTAFDVAGRRREMGLRAALGATAASLLRLVVASGLGMAAAGAAIGLGAAWLVAPSIAELLYDGRGRDPAVYVLVALVIAGAAIAGSTLPGLRASSIDPGAALREE